MTNTPETTAILRMEGGGSISVNDQTEIRCGTHGVTVRWGNLDALQQLAVEEGLDVADDLPCLLSPSRRSEKGE